MYREGIRTAYEGEVIGDNLYRRLAARRADLDQKAKLAAIADVERLTHRRLGPIAVRLGITLVEAEWRRIAERREHELAALTWHALIEGATRDWPPYVERFEALGALAPVGDKAIIQLLIDHEVALLTFARLEHSAIGSPASLPPLNAFLERFAFRGR